MAQAARPELIFVAGPEKGHRAVLMGAAASIGRSAACDIQVSEEYISREHAKMYATPEGWIIENVGSRPININGKKYKPKKKIILGTGDLVGLGLETRILFVGAGDDPEMALKALGDFAPRVESEAQAVARAEAPRPKPASEADEGGPRTQRIDDGEEDEDAAKARKYKKYMVMFGVYAAVIVVGLLVLTSIKGGGDTKGVVSDRPERLTPEKIETVLRAPLDRPADAIKARKALDEAMVHYENDWKISDRYLAYKRFKESLAYRGSSALSIEYQPIFDKVRKQVVEEVQEAYWDAWALEEQRNWPDAQRAFDRILQLVPEENEPRRDEAVYDTLIVNVRKHLGYINEQITQARQRR